MDKQNGKNYAIPRVNGDNNIDQRWVLLTKKDDQWHWVALDKSMETHIVTATDIYEAVEALKMELTDKSSD